MKNSLLRVFAASLLLSVGIGAVAAPITVTAVLTGDPRLGPTWQDLKIGVTITTADDSSVATWLVDVDSPSHIDAKLDEFYFNMAGAAGNYTIANFNPASWALEVPPTVQGGGTISPMFMFSTQDTQNGPTGDVTNTQDLTFTMTKASGFFSLSDFLNAPVSDSTDATLTSGQLGAHLQGLQQGKSGFLFGSYSTGGGGGGGSGGGNAPEPGTIALSGLALLGMAFARRRQRR